MMVAFTLLLAAAAPQAGAGATALATARIVSGERIDFAAQLRAPDREIRNVERLRGEPITLLLVEFQ